MGRLGLEPRTLGLEVAPGVSCYLATVSSICRHFRVTDEVLISPLSPVVVLTPC